MHSVGHEQNQCDDEKCALEPVDLAAARDQQAE
jgi:hypothetical protein